MHIGKISYRFFGCTVLAFLLAGCAPTTSTVASEGAQATAPALSQASVPAQAPQTISPVPTTEQQRVRLLIQHVETAYARGQADYRKGRLLEAKTEFDRAVDLMLTSGIDIKSNAELQDEFDRIVDGVNAMEMEALKQGNGFVPKEEPTPAEVASEVTFQVDPNIMAKAKAELATTKSDLPLVVNDYVAVYINFFANTQRGHNTLLHSFQRAGRYKAMIQRVMAEEGVPQDLIYLAVAESGFNPRALNRSSGAGGMWQFMPYGNYGLTRNAYVDERFDPEKSTRAYARYMKFIHDQLGDWYLSMAGYDWGTGKVQRAVQKTGYADFWELYKRNNLPVETKNYVPEILAAIIIANHPTQYGFDDITLDAPVLTDTVTINYQVDMRLVSDLVGAPTEELMALNPSLLRTVTPPDASFDLHLPAGTAILFEKRIAAIPENKRTGWRYHRVVSGDTLASVAHSYRVTAAELVSTNQLGESDSLAGVEALVIPAAPTAVPSMSSSSSSTSHARLYTVHRGDTLVSIADRFGVSLSQLRQWNNIRGTKVAAGRRLHVSDSGSAPRAIAVHGHHRRSRSSESADTRKTSSSKDVSTKSTVARRHGKSGKSARKAVEKRAPEQSARSADGEKKSRAASAKKSHARGHASGSRHHVKK
jgi:membrane-bound lytic murein transglycosylase D